MSCACRCVPKFGSPPKPRDREDDLAKLAFGDRGLRLRDRDGIPVVEVDREEQRTFGGGREQLVGFVEVEHERLLDQQGHTRLQQLEGRREVSFVRQAHTHQIRLLGVEHRGNAGVARRLGLRSLGGRAIGVAANDRDKLSVRSAVEDADVLTTPTAWTDNRDPYGSVAHCVRATSGPRPARQSARRSGQRPFEGCRC